MKALTSTALDSGTIGTLLEALKRAFFVARGVQIFKFLRCHPSGWHVAPQNLPSWKLCAEPRSQKNIATP
jgi:hypothetical protein